MKSPFGSVTMKMPRRSRSGKHSNKQLEQKQQQQQLEETTSTCSIDTPLLKKEEKAVVVSTTSCWGGVIGLSLGAGSFSVDGRTVFVRHNNNAKLSDSKSSNLSTASTCSLASISSNGSSSSSICDNNSSPQTTTKAFLRHSSSFLRVADLNMDPQHCSNSNSNCEDNDSVTLPVTTSTTMSDSSVANFSYAAVDPPPGVDHDPKERWVALDDGAGSHAPIAPFAIEALAQTGLESVLNQSMWTPHAPSKLKHSPWHACTWGSTNNTNNNIHCSELPPPGSVQESAVVLWTGKFQHGFYGSELPAVRAAGIVPCAPQQLFELLVDSTRVREYNKMSLGRDDLLVLQDSMHEEGPFGKSITKVMKSSSQPPLLRQTMEFVSILHAKELDDGSGYLCVTRAVTQPQDYHNNTATATAASSVLRSEILMGVNLIRRVEGDENRCLMINVTHLRSPMVPMIIANRIGATAAANFIKDLRAVVAT